MNPPGRRVILRIALRAAAAVAIAALAGLSRLAPGARLTDGRRWTLLAIAIAIGLGWVLAELLKLGLERLVGFRYLHRGRRSRWATHRAGGRPGAGRRRLGGVRDRRTQSTGAGLRDRGRRRRARGGLVVLVAFLLRVFSVFTTVSTMGVVLGVASLVVVFAVTSGFEREFQDKVLALNAHLIVQAYGDADFEEMDDIQRRLTGLPGVVRMAPFLFSAGEVMIGRVGANLKGIDLTQGADDLTPRAGGGLRRGSGAARQLPAARDHAAQDDDRRRPHRHRRRARAQAAQRSWAIACRSWCRSAPARRTRPSRTSSRSSGMFRMGFNEYDTRLAYVSIADAQRLANVRRLVSGVELRFADPMLALTASKDVQRRLGSPHHLVDWKELNRNLFRALLIQKVFIALILVIIIVVAAFNIVSSLTMIVLSKVREVAILKSMGAPSSMVARIFLIGGTTVGLIGTGLGIGYGLLVCLLARLYGYPLDPKVYLIGELPVQIRPEEIVGVAAATIVISWLATLYPSLRASRLRAVDGLRYT